MTSNRRRYDVILAPNAHWGVSSEPSMCLDVAQDLFGSVRMSNVTQLGRIPNFVFHICSVFFK